MATAVTVRVDFSADELRRLAAASKHANQSQRALARPCQPATHPCARTHNESAEGGPTIRGEAERLMTGL